MLAIIMHLATVVAILCRKAPGGDGWSLCGIWVFCWFGLYWIVLSILVPRCLQPCQKFPKEKKAAADIGELIEQMKCGVSVERHRHVWIGRMKANAGFDETCKWLHRVTCMNLPGTKEACGQISWKDLGLPDIRDVTVAVAHVRELPGAIDFDSALEQVALGFGLQETMDEVSIDTPLVPVIIRREYLLHIVEKRPNARERFTEFAVDTVRNPFEVWRVYYSDESYRLAFIGVYEARYQMLVVINIDRGHALWNFMNCDRKALNKHRHGDLVYQRCRA